MSNPGSIVIIDTLVQANSQTYSLVNAKDVGGDGSTNVLPTNTLPIFTSGALGAVPASGGGTTNYLKADGTWSAPGIVWNEVTTSSQALAIGNGYVMNNASQVVGTLPSSCAFGSEIKIVGKGAGGWKVAQNAGQTIHFDGNSTTTGTGGSLASQSVFDCINLLCITANTDFLVISSIGNITGI